MAGWPDGRIKKSTPSLGRGPDGFGRRRNDAAQFTVFRDNRDD
jgi:hypothetical protein